MTDARPSLSTGFRATRRIATATADAWAVAALRVLSTPFPYGAAHASLGPEDVDVTPSRLHPAFHGCLDWHSSCHMQWSLVRLLTDAPARPLPGGTTDQVVAELDARLTADRIAVEAAYLAARPGFERPYGWAWAVMLAAACRACPRPEARGWARATAMLAEQVAELLPGWLAGQAYPVRHGAHANSAFALRLLLTGYRQLGRPEVVTRLEQAARHWYGADRDYQTRYEPSGADFLSPALCEADLMRVVLPGGEFADWLTGFLPGLGGPASDRLLEVPTVRDRADGHAVHLYGLALSRAWQLRNLAGVLEADARERAGALRAAAAEQEAFATPAVTDGHFMSTHWLVSFALLATTGLGGTAGEQPDPD